MYSFAEKVKNLRSLSGKPLRVVSAYLNIDQAILSKIENGKRMASRDIVVKLSKFYGVEQEELITLWLADRIIYEVQDESLALKAMHLAEQTIAYQNKSILKKNQVVEKIKSYLKAWKNISRAWIFGSFVRGEDDSKSDLDLMIEFSDNQTVTLFDLAEIKHELEILIHREVDVVMIESVTPVFLQTIKNDLRLIYER